MNTQTKSSGALFVRYISIGLIAIFSAIAISKFGNFFNANQNAIALGIVLFSINLFTVLCLFWLVLNR